MVLEEKGGILDSFQGEDGEVKIASYLRIPAFCEDGFRRLKGRFEGYPLVLKPEFGQRGQGVEVIQDDESARRWLASCEDDVVAQEYVGGLEYGVHWLRYPSESGGRILSICQKHSQAVRGDGVKTLRQLILEDDRAVLMASYYFNKYAICLDEVIERDEEFVIAPIGTHARGAVFTDARELVTESLVKVFDELGERFPGFHFGRYDIKVPSEEAFREGRDIYVLELNGVMGEPAHIYQPGYPWWRGMMDLFSHFRRAAEIGREHRKRGLEPPKMGQLISLIQDHRRKTYLEIDGSDRGV